MTQDRPQVPVDNNFVEEAKAHAALEGFFGIAQQWELR